MSKTKFERYHNFKVGDVVIYDNICLKPAFQQGTIGVVIKVYPRHKTLMDVYFQTPGNSYSKFSGSYVGAVPCGHVKAADFTETLNSQIDPSGSINNENI